jgi:hypothetical protein
MKTSYHDALLTIKSINDKVIPPPTIPAGENGMNSGMETGIETGEEIIEGNEPTTEIPEVDPNAEVTILTPGITPEEVRALGDTEDALISLLERMGVTISQYQRAVADPRAKCPDCGAVEPQRVFFLLNHPMILNNTNIPIR